MTKAAPVRSPQPIIGLTTFKLHDDVNAPLRLCSVGEGPLRRADVEDVVASYESISILVLQLAVHVLFSLLHCDVHVTIQTGQNTSVVDAGVEFNDDGAAPDRLEEV